jgi:hypothetical protein
MPIDPNGDNPVVTASFGGIHFAGCKLFFKKKDDSSFSTILTFNGSGSDAFKSRFIYIVDPIKLIGPTNKISDLVGCELNWSILFIDYGNAPLSEYSFELTIKQGTVDLLTPPFSKTGTIDNTSTTFGNRYIFQ